MTQNIDKLRKKHALIFYALVLLVWSYRYYSNTLLHQMQHPFLKNTEIDLTYWIFDWLRIPEILTSSFSAALSFDIILVSTTILAMVFYKRPIVHITFFVLVLTYIVTFNTFLCVKQHTLTAVLIMPVAFWFKEQKSYKLALEFTRYFFLYVFASAFLWKLIRGSIFEYEHFWRIIQHQQAEYLMFFNNTLKAKWIYFLLNHPTLTYIMFLFGVSLQGAFWVGFFTKKYDFILMVFSVIFVVSNFVNVNANFFEFLIFNLSFIFIYQVQKLKL